jgi:hypothetical protein
MQDYEKLGAFYLGAEYDLAAGKRTQTTLLYDAKDLTTHAVIIGMTGSGKTGLGIGLIEEAAIDKIPVIAVDPKGDLGNLLLTFPDLAAQDFRPWVNAEEANIKGVSLDELAASTAENWKKGIADWSQDGERIRKLRETVDLTIYTPGSSAGVGISVLQSFSCPPDAVREDSDLYREKIQATASSVLGLMGIEADPVTSREHVLIATILQHSWGAGQSLDIGGLIRAIQQPPFTRIGVLDLESFYPSKDRGALAMQLNTLLASPGFDAWMQGEPLDTARLLYTESGKPRVSVISIAHLGERERMFFVSMLLNDIVSWMRTQAGTPSLRALFYMDELFGYMPPTANPPSKVLLLTMLKQARAFGLGVVLSTQNPVDLDYKGLSNIGSWFIGRLQTERDKARVMEGLEGAAAGGDFDRGKMEQTLAGLGKRVFLLRNVHEDQPVVFTTRWTLSYLAGPLTREQIKTLSSTQRATPAPAAAPATATPKPQVAMHAAPTNDAGPPLLPNEVAQYFLPTTQRSGLCYFPMIIGLALVDFVNARYAVQVSRKRMLMVELSDGPVAVDWAQANELAFEAGRLARSGDAEATYSDVPAAGARAKNYAEWDKDLARWLRTNEALTLLQSARFKAVSKPDESERDFRIRLQQLGREQRDEQIEALRKKYASRIDALQDKLRRAEQQVEKEQAQAREAQFNTVAAVGQTLLGLFVGRKARGVSRAGSSIGRMTRESGDVGRAEENLATLQQQLQELEAELQQEIEQIEQGFDAQAEPLEQLAITPKATDIAVQFVGLVWAPHVRDADGRMQPAWE